MRLWPVKTEEMDYSLNHELYGGPVARGDDNHGRADLITEQGNSRPNKVKLGLYSKQRVSGLPKPCSKCTP